MGKDEERGGGRRKRHSVFGERLRQELLPLRLLPPPTKKEAVLYLAKAEGLSNPAEAGGLCCGTSPAEAGRSKDYLAG
jgi:hypothetical protein